MITGKRCRVRDGSAIRGGAPSKIPWQCLATSALGLAPPGANRPSLVRGRNRPPGVVRTLGAGFPPERGRLKAPVAPVQIRSPHVLCDPYPLPWSSVSYFTYQPPSRSGPNNVPLVHNVRSATGGELRTFIARTTDHLYVEEPE
jgi:hypothetical protein